MLNDILAFLVSLAIALVVLAMCLKCIDAITEYMSSEPKRVPSNYEEHVRRHLTQVSRGDLSSVVSDKMGICGNILYSLDSGFGEDWEHSSRTRNAIFDMMDTWSLASTVLRFPIWPYVDTVPKWSGTQLEQRQALCKYVLDNWDEVIKNAES